MPARACAEVLSIPVVTQIRAAGLECGKAVVKAASASPDKAAQLVSVLLVVIDSSAPRPAAIGKSASMPTLNKSGSSAALVEAVEPTTEVRPAAWQMPRTASVSCKRRNGRLLPILQWDRRAAPH